MNLLLDTNVVIWMLAGPRLSPAARAAIEGGERVYVSAATIWEIAVKRSAGRLESPPDLPDRLLMLGIRPLALELEHTGVAAACRHCIETRSIACSSPRPSSSS